MKFLCCKEITVIACGGAVGSVSRFYLGKMCQAWLGASFPWGILLVNISGCFVIGFLVATLLDFFALNPLWRLLLLTGFLGGYTTFSGFTLDVIDMLQNNQVLAAILYIMVTVILCLTATWIGVLVGQWWK